MLGSELAGLDGHFAEGNFGFNVTEEIVDASLEDWILSVNRAVDVGVEVGKDYSAIELLDGRLVVENSRMIRGHFRGWDLLVAGSMR